MSRPNHLVRSMTIEKIGLDDARDFLREHHYLNNTHNGMMAWGLFGEELRGVIGFACPVSENVRSMIFGKEHKSRVTELHRLATEDNLPQNTESWFIAHSLRELKSYKPTYWGVVSFADPAQGHMGTIYQATNAIYYGQGSSNRFYEDDVGNLHHPRQNGRNISVDEAKERGWEVVSRPGKHRYVFLLPDDRKHGRELRDLLKVEPRTYPKEDDAPA